MREMACLKGFISDKYRLLNYREIVIDKERKNIMESYDIKKGEDCARIITSNSSYN